MIKINYRDEIGNVEAEFSTLEEYEDFKSKLIEKARAKNEEIKSQAEKEAKELVDKIASQWNELKSDSKALVEKAKSFGVTPKLFLELIKGAMYDASDDRCIPIQINNKAPADKQEDQDDQSDEGYSCDRQYEA